MLIDRFLLRFDVVERHELLAPADQARAWSIARSIDLRRDPMIRSLFAIRGFRSRPFTLDDAVRRGFLLLAEEPPREIVLGLVGRFWTPRGGLRQPDDFDGFQEPGYVKAAWSWEIAPAGNDASIVATETRVIATDTRAQRAFLRYWRIVGPFSALIRRRALRLIRREAAESS